MLQGLRSSIHSVPDIDAAKKWYSEALGVEPYFDSPEYVGFNLGGYELGLFHDAGETPTPGSITVYWGVADIHDVLSKLLHARATLHRDVTDVGEGILMASVFDPFGNILGLIYNPHFQAA